MIKQTLNFYFGIYSMICAREYAVDATKIIVRKTTDFKVRGDGRAETWAAIDWTALAIPSSSDPPLSQKTCISM